MILKGASIFVSDLIRKINLDVNIDFMSVSSYGNATESSGIVKTKSKLKRKSHISQRKMNISY